MGQAGPIDKVDQPGPAHKMAYTCPAHIMGPACTWFLCQQAQQKSCPACTAMLNMQCTRWWSAIK
eukprot:scaffold33109_cov23-Tisochrysis_lutea.AAC.1